MVRHEGAQEHAAGALEHEGAAAGGAHGHEAHVAVLPHAHRGGGVARAQRGVGEAHEGGGRRRGVLHHVVHGRRLAAKADVLLLYCCYQLFVAQILRHCRHPDHVVLFH